MRKVPQQPKRASGCIAPAAEVKIPYPLVTRVDFGSVKQHTAIIDNADGRAVPYRSKIDHDGAQISPLGHFSTGGGMGGGGVPGPYDPLGKWCRSTRSLPIRVIQSTS